MNVYADAHFINICQMFHLQCQTVNKLDEDNS